MIVTPFSFKTSSSNHGSKGCIKNTKPVNIMEDAVISSSEAVGLRYSLFERKFLMRLFMVALLGVIQYNDIASFSSCQTKYFLEGN